MGHTLVIVHRAEQLDSLRAMAVDDADFVAVSPFSPPSATTERWTASDSFLTADIARAERAAVDWLKEIAHRPIDGGESLVETLGFEGVSLWWFLELPLYRFCLKAVARTIAWLRPALEAMAPARVVFLDDGSLFTGTAAAVCRATGVPFTPLSAEAPFGRLRSRATYSGIGFRAGERLLQPARSRVRRALAASPGRPSLAPAGPPAVGAETRRRVLVTSMAREEITVDPATGARRHADLMLGPLLDRLASDDRVTSTFLYKFPYRWRLLVPPDIRRGGGQVITWESLGNRSTRRTTRSTVRHYRARRQELWRAASFQDLWSYEGIPLWPVIAEPLRKLWSREMSLAIKHLALSDEALRVTSPDVLVVAGETSIDNKALVARARQRRLPVIGLQHGNITITDDFFVDYAAHPHDFGTPNKEELFPTTFCVADDDTAGVLRDVLHYPFPERLVSTGQSRLDPLVEPHKHFDRDAFLRAFRLDPSKKTVLVGSQTFRIAGNKQVFMRTILEQLGPDPGLQIVVKPHPLESSGWHRRFARAVGANVTVLPPNMSAKAALVASDVLLTFYSTIATEAMVLGRPVVVVNLTGRAAPSDYTLDGLAVEVSEAAELRPTVRRILDDEDLKSRLLTARERYLARHEGVLDGHATDRILSAVLLAAAEGVGPEGVAAGRPAALAGRAP